MTKVVWLPNETNYSYCEFVAPKTPYSIHFRWSTFECLAITLDHAPLQLPAFIDTSWCLSDYNLRKC